MYLPFAQTPLTLSLSKGRTNPVVPAEAGTHNPVKR